jgi:hypothetical protein
MSRRGWLPTELGIEATRNVFGRGSRLRVLLLLAVSLGSGLAILTTLSWRQLRDDIGALERSGWTTYVLSVDGSAGHSLSPSACHLLDSRPDVTGVSAVTRRTDNPYVQLGPSSLPTVVAGLTTPIVEPTAGGTDVARLPAMLSGATMKRLSPVRALALSGGGTTYVVTAVLPQDLALAGFAGSLVVPVPIATMNQPVEACVVTVDPSVAGRDLGPSLAAALSADTMQVSTRRVLATVGNDPIESFPRRPDGIVFPAVGAIFGLALAVTMRSRASELGTYRLSGASRSALFLLLGLEHLLLGGVWALSGCAASMCDQWLTGLPVIASYPRQLLAIAVSAAVTAGFSIAVARHDVTSMIKDR